jgi:hypothetical protein
MPNSAYAKSDRADVPLGADLGRGIRQNVRVSEPLQPDDQVARYEQKVAALVDHRVLRVEYWDLHNFGSEPRVWDYGDWHHAVMGVQLTTNHGPVSVVWTDTFFPYGVEVFQEPISEHLRLGPEGPEGWPVEDHRLWRPRLGSAVRGVDTFWERFDVGPGIRQSDGVQVTEARTYLVPVALRLDFDLGPVWIVAGMPQMPDMDRVFVGGDELMVVFSSDRMREIGFPQTGFLTPEAPCR